jgi:hypothetical protein
VSRRELPTDTVTFLSSDIERFRSVFLIQVTERGLALGLPWQELEPQCREAVRLAREMEHRTHAC